MWTIEPQQIWCKPRAPGISGFMRLKNESEFLDLAIETHIDGLDELIIVHNDCSDATPELCASWARRYPEKIKVVEYEPKLVPIGTPESLTIDPRSPNCIANYYNFALSLTNRKIAIKIDGDHLAVPRRFNWICDQVRRRLPPKRRYPIYGLNVSRDENGHIVIYNYYDFSPNFAGACKKGPPPFTSGDHAFYHVDETSWHTIDPVEGFEVMDLSDKQRIKEAKMTYTFFHLKGLKSDRGTGNWKVGSETVSHVRATWTSNVLAPNSANLASIEAMRRHNPEYFRGADPQKELQQFFPEVTMRPLAPKETSRILTFRDRVADMWSRITPP